MATVRMMRLFLADCTCDPRHRHLPRPVYSALKRKQSMLDARQDKKDRLRKHKGDTTKTVAPKVVIVEQE